MQVFTAGGMRGSTSNIVAGVLVIGLALQTYYGSGCRRCRSLGRAALAYIRWQCNYGCALMTGGPSPGNLQIFQARLQMMY